MTIQTKEHITGEKATELISKGQPLINKVVDGQIEFMAHISFDKEVIIENCIIDSLNGMTMLFEAPLKITNTHFKNCNFYAAYFLKGMIIENCNFDSYLDFQMAGHNKGYPIIIKNNVFTDFVNFWDCWFMGEIIISNNNFSKGTNIESKELFMQFDMPSYVKDNIGRTDMDVERTDY